MQGNTWKKALAVLSGVAMIGTVGAVVAPANAAENKPCEAGNWDSFEQCLNQSNNGTVNKINVVNDLAHTSWTHLQGEYSTLNVTRNVTIYGNGHTISYVHFVVDKGADLTLEDTHIYDNAGSDAYHAEIPVFVGNGTADDPSTFNLNGQSSLLTDNGSGRAYAIVAGNNSVVNLNSTLAQDGTAAAVCGSSAAVVTLDDSGDEINEHQSAGHVTNATINITAGDIVNENSQDAGVFAVNVNGADVNVSGKARVQEVYVKDGTFTQTGGRVWPNLDNEYDWFGSYSSNQYPLVLDGTAQAFVSGGTLTGNYKADQGKAVQLLSANAKFNVRADERVELGGYDERAKNFGAANPVTGTVVKKGTGFAAPTQNAAGFAAPTQNPAGFAAGYTDTGLSKTINDSELRAFPAQDGEGKDTTFDLKSEAARGTAQGAASLTNRTVVEEKQVTADYSPLHGAQFVYAVGALQNEEVVASIDGIARQVYVYGQPTFVGSYNYYDGTTRNPATDANFRKASANGLFAGWYDSEKLATPVTAFPSNNAKYPFGYFVSNDTQNVFVQRTKSVNGKFTIRILSSTPNAHFNGFDFVDVRLTSATNFAQSKELTIPANKLYRTANVRSFTGKAETPQEYNESGEDAQYWSAAFITNVPDDWADSYISVTPRWTTLDGTQVTRGAQGNTNTQLPSADKINEPAVKLQPADQQ